MRYFDLVVHPHLLLMTLITLAAAFLKQLFAQTLHFFLMSQSLFLHTSLTIFPLCSSERFIIYIWDSII